MEVIISIMRMEGIWMRPLKNEDEAIEDTCRLSYNGCLGLYLAYIPVP